VITENEYLDILIDKISITFKQYCQQSLIRDKVKKIVIRCIESRETTRTEPLHYYLQLKNGIGNNFQFLRKRLIKSI